jgi:hypothetical protein
VVEEEDNIGGPVQRHWRVFGTGPGREGCIATVSATLENEADATLENEATGSCCLVCRVLGSHAGQGVDSAVA